MRVLAVVACAAGLLIPAGTFANEPVPDRGAYLVNAVMICGRCHTAPGPTGKPFAGGRMIETAAYKVQGSNITPDIETGIGAWSDEALGRAITHGVRPDGSQMSSAMPYAFYAGLTKPDLDAIIGYLRGLAPLRNAAAAPDYKVPPKADASITPDVGIAAGARQSAEVMRGAYLATLARCLGCHSAPDAEGEANLAKGLGEGGMSFEGPWGVVVAPDITPRGLADWSDEDIRRALVEGVARDGRKLAAPMQAKAYAQLVREDIAAMIAWMRALPKGR